MSNSAFNPYIIPAGLTSGPLGDTGPTGHIGSIGPQGTNVYGPTGSSIIGLTLNTSRQLVHTYENTTTKSSLPIQGMTGMWQSRITGTAEGFTNSIFYSASQSTNIAPDLSSYGDSLVLRNFSTNTPNSVGITFDESKNNVVITYNNILGSNLTSTSLYDLVIGLNSINLTGAANTEYTPSTKSFDIKVRGYAEGVTNVNQVTEGSGSNSVETWTLNTDLYTIFQLRPSEVAGLTKEIRILSTIPANQSRGITIIIPEGITGTKSQITYPINPATESGLSVKFPMNIPLFLNNLNVINMISIGPNIWYGSFVNYNTTNSINALPISLIDDIFKTSWGDVGQDGVFLTWALSVVSNNCKSTPPAFTPYTRECIVE